MCENIPYMKSRYLEKTLYEGEYIVKRAEFDNAPVLFLVLFISATILLVLAAFWKPLSKPWLGLVALFIMLTSFYGFFTEIWHRLMFEYILTNKRIIIKKGLLFSKTVEIMLDRIQGLSIDNSINTHDSTALIITTGGVVQVISHIKDLVGFHNAIIQQIEKNKMTNARSSVSEETMQAFIQMMSQLKAQSQTDSVKQTDQE